jgi:peptide-methionine (S)-S-oxide reductase
MGVMAMSAAQGAETAYAIFAGGCFWSIESDFDHAPGVISTTSGYTGGHLDNPRYEDVVTETTGHREAVKVEYDPSVTSYATLVDTFFHLIDPTDPRGQFCDFGESYTTAVFPATPEEKAIADAKVTEVAGLLGKPVATSILDAAPFWPAEAVHQDFWTGTEVLGNGSTRAAHYQRYRIGCGKNAKVEAIWGKDAFKGLDGHA